MKRAGALICAFAILFSFCGCRETKVETSVLSYYESDEVVDSNAGDNATDSYADESGSGNKNTGRNSVINNPLSVDLKGAKVTIYDSNKIFSPDAKSSKTNAAKATAIKKLQKELNCKLVIKETDGSKLQSLVSTSAAGGKALCEIITVQTHKMGAYIAGNLVADMGKISSMDLTKEYMNSAGMLDATRFGKGRYATNTAGYGLAPCVFFNKRVLREMGYPEDYIYKLVRSGKWTFDEFSKLAIEATKDTNGKPGMQADDQWGVYCMDMETGISADALTNANAYFIKFNNGKLTNNMTDPNIIKVGNLIFNIFVKNNVRGPGTGTDGVARKNFATGNGLMYYGILADAATLSSMKDKYGLVPSPKVDSSKKYSSCLDWNAYGLMIPAGLSAQKQYNAGAVVQAYMYLMDGVKSTQKTEYTNRYLCDSESAENMMIVINGLKTQPAQVYAQVNETILTGTYRVIWNYLAKVTTSMAPAIESTKTSTQIALNELNTKIKDK